MPLPDAVSIAWSFACVLPAHSIRHMAHASQPEGAVEEPTVHACPLWAPGLRLQLATGQQAFPSLGGFVVQVTVVLQGLQRLSRLQRAMGWSRLASITQGDMDSIVHAVSVAGQGSEACPACGEKVEAVPAFAALSAAKRSTGSSAHPSSVIPHIHLVTASSCWRIFHCKPRKGSWYALCTHNSVGSCPMQDAVTLPELPRLSVPQALAWHFAQQLPGNSSISPAKRIARVNLMLSKTIPCGFAVFQRAAGDPDAASWQGAAARLVGMLTKYAVGCVSACERQGVPPIWAPPRLPVAASAAGSQVPVDIHLPLLRFAHVPDEVLPETGEALTDGSAPISLPGIALVWSLFRSAVAQRASLRPPRPFLLQSGDGPDVHATLPSLAALSSLCSHTLQVQVAELPVGGSPPAAFQARIGPYKGIWFADPRTPSKAPPLHPEEQATQPASIKTCLASSVQLHAALQEGLVVLGRDSQRKYVAPGPQAPVSPAHISQCEVEVLRWSGPSGPASLNKGIVMLLLAWGVPLECLEQPFEAATLQFKNMTQSLQAAMAALRTMGAHIDHSTEADPDQQTQGRWPWLPVDEASSKGEWARGCAPLLSRRAWLMLKAGLWGEHELTRILVQLQTRALERLSEKLCAPIGRSRRLLMLPDPTGLLRPHQVFMRISDASAGPGQDPAISQDGCVLGTIALARTPCLAAHDVLTLQGVDLVSEWMKQHGDPSSSPLSLDEVLSYRHALVDVVVFPVSWRHGSVARLLAGGDFDGDEAWACWEPSIATALAEAQARFADELQSSKLFEQYFVSPSAPALDALAAVEAAAADRLKPRAGLRLEDVLGTPLEDGSVATGQAVDWLFACARDNALGRAANGHTAWLDLALRSAVHLQRVAGTPLSPGWAALQREPASLATTAAAAVDAAKAGLLVRLPPGTEGVPAPSHTGFHGPAGEDFEVRLFPGLPEWLCASDGGGKQGAAPIRVPSAALPPSPVTALQSFVLELCSGQGPVVYQAAGGSSDPNESMILGFPAVESLSQGTPLLTEAVPSTAPAQEMPATLLRMAPHPQLVAACDSLHAEDYAEAAVEHMDAFCESLGSRSIPEAVQAARVRMLHVACQVVRAAHCSQVAVSLEASEPPAEAVALCRGRLELPFELQRLALAYYAATWSAFKADGCQRLQPHAFPWMVAGDVLTLTCANLA